MLRSPATNLANLTVREPVTIAGTGSLFHPGIDWGDIAALREQWPGKLVIKGPLGAADARRAVEAGVDGLQLSNHGGRQFDRTVAPIDLLPRVRDAVGPDLTVLVDSGVRHGTDIAIAMALGADAVAIGRAYLYGLMTAGEPGVDKALDLLAEQYRRTMRLLGVTSAAELRKHAPELLVRG
jgi:L-lactate dehydrogenase (cytochrome)